MLFLSELSTVGLLVCAVVHDGIKHPSSPFLLAGEQCDRLFCAAKGFDLPVFFFFRGSGLSFPTLSPRRALGNGKPEPISPCTGSVYSQAMLNDSKARTSLGSRLIEFQSQKMTAAAKAIADRKTFGHRS
jgi:hypothetical protein